MSGQPELKIFYQNPVEFKAAYAMIRSELNSHYFRRARKKIQKKLWQSAGTNPVRAVFVQLATKPDVLNEENAERIENCSDGASYTVSSDLGYGTYCFGVCLDRDLDVFPGLRVR